MIIEIKVIPNAKKPQIKADEIPVKIYLSAPAVEGKANKALISVLAKYYAVKKNQIEIIKGLKSRLKTIKIDPI